MAYSVEDIVNMGLDAIGYPRHIGDIYEGSPAARVALEIYGETRDEVLQAGDWPFAQREVALTAVVGQVAPSPWAFEYQYPSDCLRVLYVRPGPLTGGARDDDPQPVLYQIANDTRPGTPVEAILSDTDSAILMYVGQVTDPATWQPNFIKALVAKLAEKMAFMLAHELGQIRAQMAARDTLEGLAVTDLTIAPIPAQLASAGMAINGRNR